MTLVGTDVTTIDVVLNQIEVKMREKLVGKAADSKDVTVSNAEASGHRTRDEVYIGDVRPGNIEIVAIKSGRKRANETYRIDIDFYAARQELSEAVSACAAHFSTFVSFVQDDPGLGLDINTLRVDDIDFELNKSRDDALQGWRVHITATPLVTVRIL